MTARPRWGDAESAAERLTLSDRRCLLLLARLPFLWEGAIEQLYGLRGDTSVYRCLARLRELGLIDEVRPALRVGRNPGLYYLTDLGVAALAVDRHIDPAHLARYAQLRSADLLGRLLHLPHLVGLYQMLGTLADARAGRIDLLAWEQPWRRSFRLPTRKAPVAVELPAYAALSWDDEAIECLLLPDLATFPLRVYRQSLRWLSTLRRLAGESLPTLLVATTDGRRTPWMRLLDEAAQAQGELALPSCIVTWRALRDDPDVLDEFVADTSPKTTIPIRLARLRPLEPRHPGRAIPRIVGDIRHSGSGTGGHLGSLVLQVPPMEQALLDVIGRHPFLSDPSLATVLGWEPRRLRERRARLIELGLVRLLDRTECRPSSPADLTELTRDGLELVAAQQGLSLPRAIHFNGLAGGGPEDPTGMRRLLLRDLEHTLGTDALFVGLHRQFAATDALLDGDALLEWKNAAACSGRRVRPDGYGMIRYRGEVYGFFLEYDRGTMSTRDYSAKWGGYYHYRDTRGFERQYDGFPTILVVTTSKTAEERIARSARAAAVGRWEPLPVLLTCQWRIDGDPSNPEGFLGPIWREPDAPFGRRRRWIEDKPRGSV